MKSNDGFPKESVRQAKWEKMASGWSAAQPPAIPSDGDIAIFANRISQAFSKTRNYKAAVLGATWRLRDLFLVNFESVPVFCIDWSRKMYDANTRILGRVPPLETFIAASWTGYELGTPVGVILGDKILDNLPFAEWPAFFDCAARHLSAKGSLVLHCAPTLRTDETFFTAQDYLKKWATALREGKCRPEIAASGFWEDLLTSSGSFGDKEQRTLCIAKHGPVNSLFCKDGYEEKVLELFTEIFGASVGDVWCDYTIEDISTQAAGHFEVISTSNATDYDAAAAQPIITLERK
jgi:hypothetical protein